MRTGRSYVGTAIALGIITLSGCAADSATQDSKINPNEDWGDESKYPELGGAFSALSGLASADGTCSVGTLTNAGIVTIALNDTTQTLVVGLRTVDSALLVNGKPCGTGIVAKSIKSVSIKVPSGAATNVQSVVLDFLGGQFAPGTKLVSGAAAPGITVDLGGTTGDTLAIRGSAKADIFAIGAGSSTLSGSKPLISMNSDAFPDIVLSNAAAVTLSLAAGTDTFVGTAVSALNLGTDYTGGVTVFGGAGADKLTGTAGPDVLHGGDDGDTMIGGLGDDVMYGDAGDDVFTAAAAADGADMIDCGSNATATPVGDKVSYELRTTSVKVTAGGAVVDFGADHVFGGGDDIADFGSDGVAGGTGGAADVLYVGNNDGDPTANSAAGEKDGVLGSCENLVGGLGDDVLQGIVGTNSFKGGAGSDAVDYSDRTTAVSVTLAATTATTANGDATLNSGAGEKDSIDADIENIIGGAGADTLTGNDNANEFWGMDGDDVMAGGKGNDIFHEDPLVGVDGLPATADDVDTTGADEFNGGDGEDTVDYSLRTSGVWVTALGTAVDASGNDGAATFSATVTATNQDTVTLTASTEQDNVWANVEDILGGAGSDHLVGDKTASNTTANNIEGGAGFDYIDGGEGDDTLSGGADDDYILGGAGDDTIEGGAFTTTSNRFDCGAGDDLAFGGVELTPGVLTCELLF